MYISHATREEIDEILPRVGDSLEEGSRGYYEVEQDKASRMMQEVLQKEDGQVLVVKEDSQVVGWILYGQQKDSFTGESIGFIYDLFVFENYREQGFAEALINKAMTDLKIQGMASVRLVVYAGNYAKNLYEKLGFTDNRTVMTKTL
ncbi:GNAT family N-acetyltransferase [Halobacillus seohaensis]|uniref:GNAT family N-acetyltransferase n=1 Tax=Halobacillus seohaensis TaxID=447421 RepID=A0ABW2EL22_9BACI